MLSRNVLKNEKTDNFQGFYLRSSHLEPNAWLTYDDFFLNNAFETTSFRDGKHNIRKIRLHSK